MGLDDTGYGDSRNPGRSTRHPEATGHTGPPARAGGGSTPQPTGQKTAVTAADGLSSRIDSETGPSVTVSTDTLTATLLGVPRVAVGEFVYRHQLGPQDDGDTRASALFDIENTSNRQLRWTPRQTSFIGSDGYTYRQAHLSLDPSRLGPGCHTRQVDIEPGCRARVMTLVERLPQGVEVATVHHTFVSRRHDEQRLTFDLQ